MPFSNAPIGNLNVYIEMQAKSEHLHKTFIIIPDNRAVRA